MSIHPSIPVRQTYKSMYKPISKLNGDQLPMLRKVRRPELSSRISLYNHYTERVLDTALNVSFRQHEHTMDTIRKEQAHIYKSLCRIKKLKRRVQRDEHEQRSEQIRQMFKRQRRRHLMRRVVQKFRENVIKKRAERMIQEAARESEEQPTAPVLSSQQLLKYASSLRRHTQPNVGSEVEEVNANLDISTSNVANKTSNSNTEKKDTSEEIQLQHITTEENQHNSASSDKSSTNLKVKGGSAKSTKTARKNSKTDGHLQVIPEVTVTGPNKVKVENNGGTSETSRVRGDSSSQNKLKHTLSSPSLPSNLSAYINTSAHHDNLKRPDAKVLDQQDFTTHTKEHMNSTSLNPLHSSSHDSIIDQVVRENTFETDESNIISVESIPEKYNIHYDDYENDHRVDCSERVATKQGKRRRRNMVKVIENERARRAQARTRILDEEPVTRYSRKSQEKISAMHGIPKKAEFVAPSGKLRHEQDKLIRREQDKEIQSHINVEQFFHDVFQSKAPTPYKPVEKKEEPPKKALSLASVLSQMYSSAESTSADKNSMESLKSCQYLRVYNPFLKKALSDRKGGQKLREDDGSSWAIAERKLRAGFMALNFLK